MNQNRAIFATVEADRARRWPGTQHNRKNERSEHSQNKTRQRFVRVAKKVFGTEFNAFNDKRVFARDGELTNIHNDSEKIERRN
jgi:hypothetical protein